MQRDRLFKFAVVVVIVNLHLLRNISFVGYTGIYAIMVLMLLIDYPRSRKLAAPTNLKIFTGWILVAVWGALVTAAVSGLVPAVYGFSRFLFAAPIFMAWHIYVRTAKGRNTGLVIICSMFAVSALTIPMQMVTGAVPWFASESTRAGLERYSSLAGSLTSVGIAVGCYALFANATKSKLKPLLIIAMVVGAGISLNKSAMFNVVLALGFILWANRRHLARAIVGTVVVALGVAFVIGTNDEFAQRIEATLVPLGLVEDSQIVSYDQDLDESLTHRLIDAPLNNLAALGDLGSSFAFVTGGGFGMASTALVPSSYVLAPMAHNQYPEVISVFGPIVGLVGIYLMAVIAVRLYERSRRERSAQNSAFFLAYVLFLGNAMFANGPLYQPAISTIFYTLMFFASLPAASRNSSAVGDGKPQVQRRRVKHAR